MKNVFEFSLALVLSLFAVLPTQACGRAARQERRAERRAVTVQVRQTQTVSQPMTPVRTIVGASFQTLGGCVNGICNRPVFAR